MKGKHAQKNLGAVGAMAPTTPLSFKTPGGGGGAGGCRIQGPGPAAPPWRYTQRAEMYHSLWDGDSGFPLRYTKHANPLAQTRICVSVTCSHRALLVGGNGSKRDHNGSDTPV